MSRWFPLEEPPLLEREYLVYRPARTLDRYSVQHFSFKDGWTNNDHGKAITHWMPLPNEPAGEGPRGGGKQNQNYSSSGITHAGKGG